MNAIWIGLIVYALFEAVNAANRVRQKRKLGHSPSVGQRTIDQRTTGQQTRDQQTIDQRTAGQQTRDQQTRDQRTTGQPALQQPPSPAQDPVSTQGKSSERSAPGALPIPLAPELLKPDVDMPLAATLSVHEQINPEQSQSVDLPDFVAPESGDAIDAEKSDVQNHLTVLEEIARLGRGGEESAIAHFAPYLDHPDSTIRAAAAFELGELAAHRQEPEVGQIVEQLRLLSQDANARVRSQAVTALSKIEAPVSTNLPDLG